MVTPANACPISDGAAMCLVMTADKAKELGLEPMGYIRGYAYAGVDPAIMGIGPAYAVPKALAKANLKLTDMQLIEINEAFAAQVLSCGKELAKDGWDWEKVNVNGGAIALGHPGRLLRHAHRGHPAQRDEEAQPLAGPGHRVRRRRAGRSHRRRSRK